MIREIRKKMVVLGNRSPLALQTKKYIEHLERVDWIYMNVNLDGSPLTRENVESILDGRVVMSGRVMDHVLIEKLEKLRQYIYACESRGSSINMNLPALFAAAFGDGDAAAADFRKSTPTLQVFSYTPLLPPYIPEALGRLLAEADFQGEFDNPFMKAAALHNGFMKIWPYRENNEIIARALMEYFLIRQGYPMVPLDMSESEYNSLFVDYLRNGDSTPMAQHIMKAVHDRLELMIQLTAY